MWKKLRTPSLRFSTIEGDSATAAPFSPPRSHTQCRCSRTSLCRAAPAKDAFALAWRACRSDRTAGSPPTLQNPFVALVALVFSLRNTILPESRDSSNGGNALVLEDGVRDGVRRDGIIGTYLHGAFEDPAVLAEIGITAHVQQAAGTEALAGWFAPFGQRFEELFL